MRKHDSAFHAALALIFGAILALGAGVPAQAAPRDYQQTCLFFSNGAFKDRHRFGETTFRMKLAQDCVDAMVYLQTGSDMEKDRAADYLDQLEDYRAVLVSMIVARAKTRGRSDAIWGPRTWQPAVYPVSRSGAYLIAREMGIIERQQDWNSWRRQAVLPLFRLDGAQVN